MRRSYLLVLLVPFVLGACGGGGAAPAAGKQPTAAAQALLLPTDPGAAVGVVAAKAAGAAPQVVVQGRIGGTTAGYFVLHLVDQALPFCGEKNPEDNCKTPWDYCCESKPTIQANTLLVEAREGGKPIATPALPDLRLLDLVKVAGEMTVDPHGNHVLIARGVFRVERPQVPADLRWPQ